METVIIKGQQSAGNPTGAVTINKHDFDPATHELFEAPAKPAKDDKGKDAKPGKTGKAAKDEGDAAKDDKGKDAKQ